MTEQQANEYLLKWKFPVRHIALKKSDLSDVKKSTFNILEKYVQDFKIEYNWNKLIAEGKSPHLQKGLYICSSQFGTGKTSLAVYVVRELLKHDKLRYKSAFFGVSKLHDDIKESYGDRDNPNKPDYTDIKHRLLNSDILILDDLGKERLTPSVVEKTFMYIDERYNSLRPTIFTSNYAINQIDISGTGKTGEAFMNRIKEMVEVVEL